MLVHSRQAAPVTRKKTDGITGDSMVNHKRRKHLLKLLGVHQTATVQQFVDWLHVSPATVRRDINCLAAHKLLVRTRGGAQDLLPAERQSPLSSASFQYNIQCFAARKRAIARRAASMCTDGETIIINGGTTTFMMAEFLTDKQLTIMTNSFLIADRLLVSSENDVILPAGTVYREQRVILSPFDNDVTQHHFARKMFMSVYGLSVLGLLKADPLLILAEKRLISQAEELIVLADSSKFARSAGLVLCGLDRVNIVITDTGVSDKAVQTLEQYGVKVVTVEPDEVAPDTGAPYLNPEYDLHSVALLRRVTSH
jgi:DeoR family ulaG and ulaABCDEF operon transcriptional repressor